MKMKSLFIVCEYNIVIDCISMEVIWVFGFKVEIFFFEIINCFKFKINNCCFIFFIMYNMIVWRNKLSMFYCILVYLIIFW